MIPMVKIMMVSIKIKTLKLVAILNESDSATFVPADDDDGKNDDDDDKDDDDDDDG